MIQPSLRTPITYYGGKQRLISEILPRIPQHTLYCEPFIGGAAVFFAKEPSKVEVINDTNREVINFYQVCKNHFHKLQALVATSLHSRSLHDDAWVVYNKPHLHDEIRRAWAVWVLAAQSFSSSLTNSWGFDLQKGSTSKKIDNKRQDFTEQMAIRLQRTQIECADAIYIIGSRDTTESFFYVDPPYYNSNMGHYDGYTESDFEALLKLLGTIKGKFLLSSYPSDLLKKYTELHNWSQHKITQRITADGGLKKRNKIEVLTWNY
jgi:DNA adenine methylase